MLPCTVLMCVRCASELGGRVCPCGALVGESLFLQHKLKVGGMFARPSGFTDPEH